ncbi:hypothetical protein M427DRAFT_30839 [Gonapodya prolifera JEL478]|uniref:Uncharacterized protein n=1 Tax=Gonapodya prolifera (strain JEL478) TaxID=1344416 RepID=A0A139AJS5_GONPJ|nr:hypothetical protein M427DRAFT_30839 [Gonapodya prolifera JEL478]|eukprot:KXS17032.1 hypothetical protein M427DRAFT_30839 [Gonapodya prolifera JEL478]
MPWVPRPDERLQDYCHSIHLRELFITSSTLIARVLPGVTQYCECLQLFVCQGLGLGPVKFAKSRDPDPALRYLPTRLTTHSAQPPNDGTDRIAELNGPVAPDFDKD